MKKRNLVLLLVAFLVLLTPVLFAAGEKDAKASSVSAADAAKYPYPGAVGKNATMILKDLTNPIWVACVGYARDAAKDFGMNIETVAPVVSQSNEQQIQLVQQVIAQRKDVCILVPCDSTGIIPAVLELNRANIPVINLNTWINDPTGRAKYETFVVADNIRCATLVATYGAKLADHKGEILILQGVPGAQVNIDIIKGAVAVFDKHPEMKIVQYGNANSDRQQGYTVTQNMLQTFPNLRYCFSTGDEMALGAMHAIEEAGRQDRIILTGCDGNQDALRAVRDGRMNATVNKNFQGQVYAAVKAAAMVLDGKKLDPLVPVDMILVTKENASQFIQ